MCDSTIELVKESYNYYKDAKPYHLHIYMRAINGNFEDPYLREAIDIFHSFGLDFDFADTCLFDFDLNNDWFIFDCPNCIRDYGFSIPIVEDVDKIARFVELVWTNKIIVFIKDISD